MSNFLLRLESKLADVRLAMEAITQLTIPARITAEELLEFRSTLSRALPARMESNADARRRAALDLLTHARRLWDVLPRQLEQLLGQVEDRLASLAARGDGLLLDCREEGLRMTPFRPNGSDEWFWRINTSRCRADSPWKRFGDICQTPMGGPPAPDPQPPRWILAGAVKPRTGELTPHHVQHEAIVPCSPPLPDWWCENKVFVPLTRKGN